MKKLHPEFEEPVRERIFSFIERFIDNIEENPTKNQEDIINDFIKQYYNKRIVVDHFFSDEFLNYIKNKIIIPLLDNNQEYFNINEDTKGKIVICCLDLFLEKYFQYREMEIDF
ncbi:MAG: hypothetical protein ACFFHV_14340 [Promethearchaeota archaeon]